MSSPAWNRRRRVGRYRRAAREATRRADAVQRFLQAVYPEVRPWQARSAWLLLYRDALERLTRSIP